jgi:hypothetical protein
MLDIKREKMKEIATLCHINVGDWQWVNFMGPMDSTSASDIKDLEI